MQVPFFVDPQFVDASGPGGLNAAANTFSGSLAGLGSAVLALPGLISPEAMSVTLSGMVATVALPNPWALVNASGNVIGAHGTITGQDTQTYSVNFTSLIPSSGSVSAYLLASGITIQQSIVLVPGPPPGHPSWNPQFVPTTSYAKTVDSVALFASTTAPDNETTFALFGTTLTAGQSTLTTIDLSTQFRAAVRKTDPYFIVGNGLLTPAMAQAILIPGSTQTNTLPSSASSSALTFRLFTGANTWTIAASGSDTIYLNNNVSGSSIAIPPYCFCSLHTFGGPKWFVDSISPSFNQQPAPFSNGTAPGIDITEGYNQSVSGGFTAPCDGWVIAGGGINLGAGLVSGNITATLRVNGTSVAGDSSPGTMTHDAVVFVNAGTVVTVSYQIQAPGPVSPSPVVATYHVKGQFQPNP